ncbi:MAG: hypothetical protein OXT67_08080 [Zetaproteobacteria bacterium]|nr:hypothetical protein [Zetaproteobacteria bacterium]
MEKDQYGICWRVQYRALVYSALASCVGVMLTLTGCGNMNVTGSQTEATLKDVSQTATVESGQATSLSISDGSASGTEVEIPAGELPEGTTLELDRVEAPSQFTDLAEEGGDGETKFATASSAISIEAGDTEELTNAMSLSIPYSGANLALFLLAVEKSTSNLCILHLSKAGQMYVFRNELVSVDSENRKIKFSSKTFGIYQAIFCGNKEVADSVADAGTQQIAGVPPGSDTKSFSSYGGEFPLKIVANGSTVGAVGKHLCFMIGFDRVGSDGAVSGDSVIHAVQSGALSAENITLDLTINTKDIPDRARPFVSFLVQDNSGKCGYSRGDTFSASNKPEYAQAYVYPTTKKYLSQEKLQIELGKDAYELRSFKLTIGSPSGDTSVDTSAPAQENNCAVVDHQDSDLNPLGRSAYINFPISGTIGQEITIRYPKLQADSESLSKSIIFNKKCESDLLSFDYSSTYKLALKDPDAQGDHFIRPVDVGLDELSFPSTLLAVASTFCMEAHKSDFIAATSAVTHPSKPESAIGRWSVTSNLGAKFFISYPATAPSSPLKYDLLVSPQACSKEAPSVDPFVLHDRSLH